MTFDLNATPEVSIRKIQQASYTEYVFTVDAPGVVISFATTEIRRFEDLLDKAVADFMVIMASEPEVQEL
jgi:hypothetical protein